MINDIKQRIKKKKHFLVFGKNATLAEYSFLKNEVVHILKCYFSTSDKTGKLITLKTFHFTRDQIKENSLANDIKTCFNCPYSYNQNEGRSGGCYTHNSQGVLNVLRGYHNKYIRENKTFDFLTTYDQESFNKFLIAAKSACNFCRFGSYGEAVEMPKIVIEKIAENFKTIGYTHRWTANKYSNYFKYGFQASTDGNKFLQNIAIDRGWKCFHVVTEGGEIPEGFINCPASFENKEKLLKENKDQVLPTCNTCKKCDGKTGNVYIFDHSQKAKMKRRKKAKK